jgi:hypothetical protein
MGTAGASYGVSRSLRTDRAPCVLDAAPTRAGAWFALAIVKLYHIQTRRPSVHAAQSASPASKAIPIGCEDDGFREGLNPSYGLQLSKHGLEPVTVEETDHYKVMREFCSDPAGFMEAAIEE